MYVDNVILATVLRELSWSNNLAIMSRSKSMEERDFLHLISTIKKH
ncbi:MAG: hypothetical protein KBF13_10845 [Prevotella sp.]|nr:hypothetical protein [Prevotella sp.]